MTRNDGREPFAYMSSANYRGLRSPWSLLLLATVFFVFVIAGIVMRLTEKGTSTAGVVIIVIAFGGASAVIYYIGF